MNREHICVFDFKGGDRLKFGDVVMAVAVMVVITYLIGWVFGLALIPSSLGSNLGTGVAGVISLIIAGLLVGYAFAGKIQEESRVRAVGKIAVLLAAATVFLVIIVFSGNSYYWANIKENLQTMYSTGTWSTMDWFAYEQLVMLMNVALNAFVTLVVGFVGLYLGSLLKPKKS